MRKIAALLWIIFISVIFFHYGNEVFAQSPQGEPQLYFIKMKSKPSTLSLLSVNDSIGQDGVLLGGLAYSNLMVVRSVGGLEEATLTSLQNNSNVESVAKMPKIYALSNTNDPFLESQWALTKMKVAGTGETAWDKVPDLANKTALVKVAVIDSGVNKSHPDLAGKIAGGDWVECEVDTQKRFGCTVNNNGTDPNGHGTHVAGIMAGAPNNNLGIAGVGWGVKILSIKVLDNHGQGNMATALLAMGWAVDHGAKVINMSLGGIKDNLEDYKIDLIQEYIDQIWNRGAVIVAAAGNCGGADNHGLADCQKADGTYISNSRFYPAASNHVIAVAALGANNALAPYSEHNDSANANIGNWISVAAPGGSCGTASRQNCILSTWSTNAAACTLPHTSSEQYCYQQGTSMASPQVAGVAALLFAANPNLTNAQVKNAIESTANRTIVPGATNNGLVDALAAVNWVLQGSSGATPTVTPTGIAGTPTVTPTGILASPTVTPTVGPSATPIPPTLTPTPLPTATPTITPFPTSAVARLPKTPYPPVVSTPFCPSVFIPSGGNCSLENKQKGDANCDGKIDYADYLIWQDQFDTTPPGVNYHPNANFNCIEENGTTYYVDLVDFEIWRRNTEAHR